MCTLKFYKGGGGIVHQNIQWRPFYTFRRLKQDHLFKPYLISLNISSKEDFPTTSGHYIEKFISLFGDIEHYGNLQTFSQIQFQDLYTWLCKADNGIICNNNALVEFCSYESTRSNLLCREVTGHYMNSVCQMFLI